MVAEALGELALIFIPAAEVELEYMEKEGLVATATAVLLLELTYLEVPEKADQEEILVETMTDFL